MSGATRPQDRLGGIAARPGGKRNSRATRGHARSGLFPPVEQSKPRHGWVIFSRAPTGPAPETASAARLASAGSRSPFGSRPLRAPRGRLRRSKPATPQFSFVFDRRWRLDGLPPGAMGGRPNSRSETVRSSRDSGLRLLAGSWRARSFSTHACGSVSGKLPRPRRPVILSNYSTHQLVQLVAGLRDEESRGHMPSLSRFFVLLKLFRRSVSTSTWSRL